MPLRRWGLVRRSPRLAQQIGRAKQNRDDQAVSNRALWIRHDVKSPNLSHLTGSSASWPFPARSPERKSNFNLMRNQGMRRIAWCSSFGSVHFLCKSWDALTLRLRNVRLQGELDAGRSRQPEVHKPSDPAERKTPASNPSPCAAGTRQGSAFHRTERGDPAWSKYLCGIAVIPQ